MIFFIVFLNFNIEHLIEFRFEKLKFEDFEKIKNWYLNQKDLKNFEAIYNEKNLIIKYYVDLKSKYIIPPWEEMGMKGPKKANLQKNFFHSLKNPENFFHPQQNGIFWKILFTFPLLWKLFFLVLTIFVFPIFEELLFRAIILGLFARGNKKILGTIYSSFIFFIMHFNLKYLILYFIISIILSIIYLKSRDITSPILCHIMNNAIYFILIYVS